MNIVVLSGRLYNGAVYGYVDDNTKMERSCFRGRLNFRMPNGKYDWIDVICWKDNPNTEENGLVGWLEQHYLAPEDETEGHGGKAIEVVGWLRPVEKQKTVTVKTKTGKRIDISGVKYMTFELVIDQANFPPLSHGENNRDNGLEIDDDFDPEEDDLVVSEDDDEDDVDEEEVATRRTKSSVKNASSRSAAKPVKKSNGKARRRIDDDDDNFFVED